MNKATQPSMHSQKTALHIAAEKHLTEPHQALAVLVNGVAKDLSVTPAGTDALEFLSFDDPRGKEVFWHTSAHVLAQAVLRLFPHAKPTIGPPIEQGFYYDFANLTIGEDDLKAIEEEMRKICKEDFKPLREEFLNKNAALSAFAENAYKQELIGGFDDNGIFSAYRQGEFYDLCRGPHLPRLGKIRAIKLTKVAGAYWRGDSNREMLTRIYGITFPDKKMLTDYLEQLEEAQRRDHKILGPKLGLFSLLEEAPGMPFIHPKGMFVWEQLVGLMRSLHKRYGYIEIKTPQIMTRGLWETSGHWANYRQNMYTTQIEERDFAIKPMNCPGCMLYFKSLLHSYKEFPLRVAEFGHVHRYEASGALSGLFRVRAFHQDDAHIFMEFEQIEAEVLKTLALVNEIYSTFDLTYRLELSTRPEKNTIGSDEQWEMATTSLRNALESHGHEFRINHGDGAFYGPKIDFHVKDAIGRTWQCGTIQVDMALPERFELEYIAKDGHRKRPVMLHRAVFGSIERFFGILIEHFAGKFPLWMSPRQVRIMTIADRHIDYAKVLKERFESEGFICEIDDSSESLGKKVRLAQIEHVNYMLTVGDRECEEKTIGLRTRDNVVHGSLRVDAFIEKIRQERDTRALSAIKSWE